MTKKEVVNSILDMLEEMADEYMLEEQYENASIILSAMRRIMTKLNEEVKNDG